MDYDGTRELLFKMEVTKVRRLRLEANGSWFRIPELRGQVNSETFEDTALSCCLHASWVIDEVPGKIEFVG